MIEARLQELKELVQQNDADDNPTKIWEWEELEQRCQDFHNKSLALIQAIEQLQPIDKVYFQNLKGEVVQVIPLPERLYRFSPEVKP